MHFPKKKLFGDPIKEKSKQELLATPEFQNCFEDWKKRCHERIISEGGYFKGNNIVIHK